MKRMLVLGATSEIAVATLKEFARQDNWHFILTGRNIKALHELAHELENSSDLKCSCQCHYFDTAMTTAQMKLLWDIIVANNATKEELCSSSQSVTEEEGALSLSSTEAGSSSFTTTQLAATTSSSTSSSKLSSSKSSSSASSLDAVFCSIGLLGDQIAARHDIALAKEIFDVNFNGLVPILSWAADYFEERKSGSLMVVSSVAGERGRCSNYCYGASKAAMSAFLSGLRVRLFSSNVHVMTIKPGYVATRMVAHKKLPPYITASVETVARDIVKGYNKRSDIVYTMWIWRYIMLGTRILPEFIFKRLSMF